MATSPSEEFSFHEPTPKPHSEDGDHDADVQAVQETGRNRLKALAFIGGLAASNMGCAPMSSYGASGYLKALTSLGSNQAGQSLNGHLNLPRLVAEKAIDPPSIQAALGFNTTNTGPALGARVQVTEGVTSTWKGPVELNMSASVGTDHSFKNLNTSRPSYACSVYLLPTLNLTVSVPLSGPENPEPDFAKIAPYLGARMADTKSWRSGENPEKTGIKTYPFVGIDLSIASKHLEIGVGGDATLINQGPGKGSQIVFGESLLIKFPFAL